MAIALFPGSFDPIHLGHLDVVEQVASRFDQVVVAVLGNPSKSTGLFDRHLRERLVSASTIVRSPVDAGEVAAAASLVPEAVAAELWRWARDLSGSGADPSR